MALSVVLQFCVVFALSICSRIAVLLYRSVVLFLRYCFAFACFVIACFVNACFVLQYEYRK